MNKTCARCQKVVYPIEELKCLDKTWHKTCFKCTECGMALNMKTYKGFNKMPYCEAHIPKAKATAIADTPELKRIAENTKIQSNVKYHEDFEKAKGKFTQVADDPETLRIKQNTKHISNVAYHGDLEKKAAMEKQRGAAEVSDSTKGSYYAKAPTNVQQQQQQQANSQYQQPNSSYNQLRSAILQSSHHPTGALIANDPSSMPLNSASSSSTYNHTYDQYDNNSSSHNSYAGAQQQQQQQRTTSQAQMYHNNNVINNGTNNNNGAGSLAGVQAYQTPKGSAATTPSYGGPNHTSNNTSAQQQLFPNNAYNNYPTSAGASIMAGGSGSINGGQQPTNHHHHHHHHNSNGGSATINGSIGRIADYDPLSDGPRPLPNTGRASTTLIYSSDNRGNAVNNSYGIRIGSIADIDPVNGIYGSLTAEQHHQQQQQQTQQHLSNHNLQQQQQQHPQYYQQMPAMPQQNQQSHHSLSQQKQSKQNLRIYRALYDYEAQDVDEVSFREGDIIFEVESIDSGWMTGRVERTGKTGMLPANYVEQAVI
ncbi:LIM and SH3 domain protein Lasp isoform X6 [Haematobia irritans]|uniref:LIM and SH3 domain protein Lasp isoform X6 n=1 Tax=Haematobia irritans TaxID=7368 RepID=UPI003F505B88